MKENEEEREFQLELMKLQIKHQDLLSVLTLFLAILFSAMVSLVTTYLNFFLMTGDLNWAYTVLAMLVIFPIAMLLTVRYYGGQGARILEKGLNEEIQKIRTKFIETKSVEKRRTGKENKENKQKEKNGNSMSKYEKLAVIFALFNIILIGLNVILVVQTNQIQGNSLEFQRTFQSMMYNFTSVIAVDTDTVFLGEPSEYSSHDGIIEKTTHYGYLDVDITVVTPHYGTLSIRITRFNVGESPMLDSEKRNQTEVSYAFKEDEFEKSFSLGLNHIAASLHLKAIVYPSSEDVPPHGEPVQFILGRLFLEAEVFDIQTEETITKDFSAVIVIGAPP